MSKLRPLTALFMALGAASVLAQTPAPATTAPAAAAPAATAASTSPCVKPGHYPGKKASDNKKEAWVNDMRAWGDCVKNYVADLRAQIDTKIKLANSTIEDYNAGLKELQEEQRTAESGPAK
jgi:hypothetical protein